MKRLRSPEHLRFIRTLRCAACRIGGPSNAHHLMHAQPSAMGLKSGDEWTVPLCFHCHERLHRAGNEPGWWAELGIDPIVLAQELWATGPGPKLGFVIGGGVGVLAPHDIQHSEVGKENAA
jgi:hypothetical protein